MTLHDLKDTGVKKRAFCADLQERPP